MNGSLPKLRIGPILLDLPVMQAALAGYSDWPMRILARRMGAPYTLSQVVLDRLVLAVRGPDKQRRLLHTTDDEHPVGGQLMGAEPDEFAAAAVRLVETGFDAVDINFGCPVKKVLGRCRGGYHLGQPDVALAIVRRVRDAVPDHIPVTVKMRRGLDDSQASREKFFEILDGAFDAGVAAAAVHARTVQQRYDGPSRREFLREVKQHAGDRVILGSGDVFSAQDCLDTLQQTGVDGVLVARGAIGNPWIFQQIRALAAGRPMPQPPSLHQQRDVIREHYRLAEQVYGPNRCGTMMRKFGIRYSHLHPQQKEVRNAFVTARCREDWDAVLDRWYADDLPGRYPGPEIHKM